jgi:hypothetical protein
MVIKIRKSFVILTLVLMFATAGFGVVSALNAQTSDSLPIVMYHQLTADKSKAGKYVLTLEQFEKDLIYLKENGYVSVTLNQLFDFANGISDLPEKPFMITFDDGCETIYSYALPLLEKYGFNAVCFVIGSVADNTVLSMTIISIIPI